jgi:ankyrin repeat protein
MSFYPTKDIIEMIGIERIGYELKDEYKSIEEKIEDIRKEKNMSDYNDACAGAGQIEYLRYLRENGSNFYGRICTYAAIGGHIECLKYAYENGCEPEKMAFLYTAEAGQTECLIYLRENGCDYDDSTAIVRAVYNGHIGCLRYLHMSGFKMNRQLCMWAAQNGHIECLRYLHENGCEWDENTCEYAAEGGQIECLRYAHENGCPWNEKYMRDLSGECKEYYERHMKKMKR